MAVMISSGSRLVSRCGVSPGSRWKSENAMARAPAGPATCTLASSAASATHMSEGCVAMQASLVPRMALMRLMPDIAEQPLPGCALVAGRHRVVEVKAPRALHEIAAGRCHVAQLLRRAGQDRAREQRIALFDQRVVGEVGVRHQRPDEKAAVRRFPRCSSAAVARCRSAGPGARHRISSGRSDWCRPR